ncbi:28339_t:CDS:1, partial [Dentiscutata erythropus]
VYNASKVDIKNEGDNSTGLSKKNKIIVIAVGLFVGLIVIGVVIVYIRRRRRNMGVEKPIVIENPEDDMNTENGRSTEDDRNMKDG